MRVGRERHLAGVRAPRAPGVAKSDGDGDGGLRGNARSCDSSCPLFLASLDLYDEHNVLVVGHAHRTFNHVHNCTTVLSSALWEFLLFSLCL